MAILDNEMNGAFLSGKRTLSQVSTYIKQKASLEWQMSHNCFRILMGRIDVPLGSFACDPLIPQALQCGLVI